MKSKRRRVRPPLLAPVVTRLGADDPLTARVHREPALGWVHEALEHNPDYAHRRMFGCDAAYVAGRICLVTAAKHEPWNGLLVCTSLDRQAALVAEWPALAPHRVLPKWLYISQDHPDFERTADAMIRRVLAADPRIGVLPKPRSSRLKHKAKITRGP